MMLTSFLMIIGFMMLVKGADLLVDGASDIARKYQVSDLVIGLTVVAFGTSSPELFVNIISSLKGNTGIAIGNVLGSNVANILLILGVASIICPLTVTKGTVWKEIPFGLLAALALGVCANDRLIDGMAFSAITRSDGMIFIFFFMIFMYYSFAIARDIEGMESYVPSRKHTMPKALTLVLIGLAGLTLGGKWIVDGAITIALYFGMEESVVGLTIVAIGTSLPELATSAVAAYRKNVEIAVGNVVGSNIFNVFLVLGISSIIKPLPFQPKNNFDIGIVILANILLFISMFTGGRRIVDRWEGGVFLAIYLGYMIFLVASS